MKKLFNVLALWLLVGPVWSEEKILPVDEAFKQTVVAIDGMAAVTFDIADGYYLYRHAFKFDGLGVSLSEAQIPQGKKKTDEFFGEVETYRKQVVINIPYQDAQAGSQLEVKFQGCADAGICYPPQKRLFDVPESRDQLVSSTSSTLSFSNEGNSFFGGATSLPVSEAFRFEVIALSDKALSARFTMAPHIYLYKDQIQFSTYTQGIALASPEFPPAVKKDDPEFGLVDVYYDVVEITVPFSRSVELSQVDIEVAFQGCEDGKICYPPDSRMVAVDLPKAEQLEVAPLKTVEPEIQVQSLSETQQLTANISQNPMWLTVLKFFGFGLLLSLTPCVFPMIPILSSLIVGQKNPSTSRAFVLSLTYVLAMALTYTVVGIVAGLMGANLQAIFQKPWIIISFSVVFVLLALSMFGYYELQLPAKWQNKLSNISNKQKSGSILGVAVMGFLSALIVGPCVAPPLAAAVIYISTEHSGAVLGGLALFAMSMGMGIPLIAIGTSAGKWMPSSGGWMNVVKAFFGIALLGMAIWFMSRILDANVVLFMWAGLIITSAFMWSAYAKNNGLTGVWASFFDAVKVVGVLIGAAQLVGAMAGGTDPIKPLKGVFSVVGQAEIKKLEFTKIKSLEALQAALKASDKPVYFDFYADWCTECKRMEATTFQDPDLVALSSQLTLLKADVTANDEIDAALMGHFQIVGPPASLFFAAGGAPLVQHNFFGYKSAKELKQTFEKILN
ncbi:protein-disulfide reductase DsbD [Marinicella rhabdoformis]|uniref:protein-disulfide reductase DsbD n=1 Tax=Marinicella rhabdoformis TaxID=2580566 RepID=UPI0012AED46F|nr:protein-disulfide reductase DsbD [Marinicella rhabdoformis]